MKFVTFFQSNRKSWIFIRKKTNYTPFIISQDVWLLKLTLNCVPLRVSQNCVTKTVSTVCHFKCYLYAEKILTILSGEEKLKELLSDQYWNLLGNQLVRSTWNVKFGSHGFVTIVWITHLFSLGVILALFDLMNLNVDSIFVFLLGCFWWKTLTLLWLA